MTFAAHCAPIEEGAPTDNSDAFRRALGHFSTGVTIITAAANGTLAGITANSFSSVSLDPPLILWSVKKSSTSWPVFEQTRSFAVNVLAADQAALAAKFARSGTDKFEGVEWLLGAGGAPVIAGVTAEFECERRFEHDGGDHIIVVGEVMRFARHERRPLVFTQGRFSIAIDNAGLGQATLPVADATTRPTFLTQLRRAFLQRGSEFRDEARDVGFTMNESRLTYHMELNPGLSLEDLARVALLDILSARDSIADLQERGWVRVSAEGKPELTAEGRDRNRRLAQVASASEAGKLSGFSEAEIEIGRQVIAALGGRLDNIPVY